MSRSLTGGRPAREKEINEIRKSTDCTAGKMIFTKLRDKNMALLVNSGGIAAVRVLRSNASKIGGIYLGKIQNVAKNIDACFVENCAFCHYGKQVRHILPTDSRTEA